MIEIKVDEQKQELKEKIVKEFLEVMDFELVEINEDSIIIRDKNSGKTYGRELNMPIDFNSEDNRRIFNCSRLDISDYFIEVLSAKDTEKPFTKNGISDISLEMSKDKKEYGFKFQLFYDEKLYELASGKTFSTRYLNYEVKNEDGIVEFEYGVQDNNRDLWIIEQRDAIKKSIYIQENYMDDKHTAVLIIKENNHDVYSQELEGIEIEVYFRALAFKASTLVQNANNVLKTLNHNLYNIVFSSNPITYQFMELMENARSNEIVEQLYEEYMSFDGVKRTLKDKNTN